MKVRKHKSGKEIGKCELQWNTDDLQWVSKQLYILREMCAMMGCVYLALCIVRKFDLFVILPVFLWEKPKLFKVCLNIFYSFLH